MPYINWKNVGLWAGTFISGMLFGIAITMWKFVGR